MGKGTGSVLPAKLTMPKVDGATLRPRLFQLLDQARQTSVVWVSAPAGSGKTTLVASYLKYRKIKPLWYQMDIRDADPAAFFAYLRQAVAKLAPRKRETLQLLTPEYALGLPVFTLNFFEEVFARLRQPAVIVFDNFQELEAQSPLHELLPQIIAVMPEGVNVIFISRTDMPESFASLRASQRVAHIAAEAMRLRDEEAIEIGKQLSQDSAEERLESLNRQAGGWLAGLILLLESKQNLALGKEIDTSVFDYFAAEIMRRADENTQAFLVESALLPVMNAGATAALTGNAAAEVILNDLVKRNYFISRVPGEVMRYEFHPLFRSFLRTELLRLRSAEQLRDLRRRAGHILLQQGEYAAAVELLAEAVDVEALVGLVLGNAEKLIAEGQFRTLENWLRVVPQQAYSEQPWLSYWLGVSRMPYDLTEAMEYFESAYAAFAQTDDPVGCYMSWAGIAECYNLMWDDYSGMMPWLQTYRDLRERYPAYPSAEVEIIIQAALFGVLMFLQPQHPDCEIARHSVEAAAAKSGDPDFRIKLLSNLAFYYSWAGAFADMRRVVEMGEALVDSKPVSPLSRIMVKAHRGTLSWITGEPAATHDARREALEIAAQSGVHLLDSFIFAQSCYASGVQHDPESMAETLDSFKQHLLPGRRIDLAHYYFQVAWCMDLRRDFSSALEYAHQGMELLGQASAQIGMALGNLALGKILVQLGDHHTALWHFAQGLQFSREMPSPHLEFTALMLRAYSWLKQDDETACKTDLQQALQIAANRSDYWTFPLWDSEMVSRLCLFALQRDIESNYVRALIRKWQLNPPGEIMPPEFWPWPVRIHALGRFSVSYGEQPAKPAAKVAEMLKALIAMGGRDIAEQQISDHLWPDAEGDQARQSFKVTLHRLRKLIGQESLLLSDGRLSLDPRRVWVDVWTFERNLSVMEKSKDEMLPQIAAEMIDSYQGGLLPGETVAWILSARERLRSRFLRIIGQAAERLCELGQWQTAIDCYRRALETDPLAERFYRGLMRCHYQLGQAAEGLAVYQRCQETLASELQISPSRETEQLQQLLRQS